MYFEKKPILEFNTRDVIEDMKRKISANNFSPDNEVNKTHATVHSTRNNPTRKNNSSKEFNFKVTKGGLDLLHLGYNNDKTSDLRTLNTQNKYLETGAKTPKYSKQKSTIPSQSIFEKIDAAKRELNIKKETNGIEMPSGYSNFSSRQRNYSAGGFGQVGSNSSKKSNLNIETTNTYKGNDDYFGPNHGGAKDAPNYFQINFLLDKIGSNMTKDIITTKNKVSSQAQAIQETSSISKLNKFKNEFMEPKKKKTDQPTMIMGGMPTKVPDFSSDRNTSLHDRKFQEKVKNKFSDMLTNNFKK